eukprot:2876985-Pleurochrysis_carterae.AAC.4
MSPLRPLVNVDLGVRAAVSRAGAHRAAPRVVTLFSSKNAPRKYVAGHLLQWGLLSGLSADCSQQKKSNSSCHGENSTYIDIDWNNIFSKLSADIK